MRSFEANGLAMAGPPRGVINRRQAQVRLECDAILSWVQAALCAALAQLRILHHSVVDLAEAERDDVERVVLIEPPRSLRALLGHLRDRTLHIAGGEIQRRHRLDGG